MRRSLDLLCLACALACATIAAGCQASGTSARRPDAAIDPCAERLHDVCGRLLFYCSVNGKLPEKLDDLKRVDSSPLPPLVCPVSGKPYLYNKEGLPTPGRAGFLVVYDAAAVHGGMRWGVWLEAAGEGQPLSGRIVRFPESLLAPAKKPPQSRAR